LIASGYQFGSASDHTDNSSEKIKRKNSNRLFPISLITGRSPFFLFLKTPIPAFLKNSAP